MLVKVSTLPALSATRSPTSACTPALTTDGDSLIGPRRYLCTFDMPHLPCPMPKSQCQMTKKNPARDPLIWTLDIGHWGFALQGIPSASGPVPADLLARRPGGEQGRLALHGLGRGGALRGGARPRP